MDAVKLLGSLLGNKSLSSGLGSQLLGGLLGGGNSQQQQPQQPQRQSAAGGGLAGILGSVLGGSGSSGGGGGISDLLGSIMGGGQSQPQRQSQPAAQSSVQHGQSHQSPAGAPQDQAVLMIRAMVNAAKSDGRIDQSEQENIISKLGADVSESEVKFLKQEFAAPLDVASFARSVPRGLEQQVYAMSLTSIELDTQNEAQYLGKLAQGLNIDPQLCNQIHDQLGAPKIFQA